MDNLENDLLYKISGLHKIPEGKVEAFNIRENGTALARNSTAEIIINPKTDKPGIDIIVKENVKNKSVHIPVLLTKSNFNDVVYNDFYIGKNSDVTIIAGCGIHNSTCSPSEHDGIHAFHLDENSKVKYVEVHIGEGEGSGDKILNPTTKIFMKKNSIFDMETTQVGGVSSANRKTFATLYDNAKLTIHEKILTTNNQKAITNFTVNLIGKDSSVNVISRSVAKNSSMQEFKSNIRGKNECFGHVECDGIMLDNAKISSTPKINAMNINSTLIHEAAIGKIAGDEIVKLMTLGLDKKQAEDLIIQGYLN
jgi:Fe-S cluster assembly scaffold protein SufB